MKEEKFVECVFFAEYENAMVVAKDWSLEKMTSIIIAQLREEGPAISCYGFFVYLLSYWPIEKHLAIHETLGHILSAEMNDIMGGGKMTAIYHLREALALAPDKEENKLQLEKLLDNVT
ncbi:hypothetical protein [Saprospira grandis]|uniref:Uncharacterized protein n=1 Tax=Saprospira grandis (strain Lewin) TaxID=984262 RepID=H6L2Y3_SAPGL|nr:hypothetical protein [Saprospira grandis]AFC23710.1 hypothetical protein SGRA_0974 [Saprospira grandis str. Lewin]